MRPVLSFLTFCSVTAVSVSAVAYCQTTVCDAQNPPDECYLAEYGCPTNVQTVAWPKNCTSFSVQVDGSGATNSNITASEFEGIIRMSFDRWQYATCADGRHPNIAIETYPQVTCNESRYNKDGPNQNVWLFRDNDWPHVDVGDRTIALTLVQFGAESGDIYDVDVELNSHVYTFTRGSNYNLDEREADLSSVVQHESGHFLGLAHSMEGTATMYDVYVTGDGMSSLSSDDVAGICAAYPPVYTPMACDAEPRHGFSTKCSTADNGCSVSVIGASRRKVTVFLSCLLLGLLLFRRRPRNNEVSQ